ncbi:hypothetical protein HZB94_04465 [Candidatus Falkowbacteria bacterium]|nr:hypothetical protein [Candidatus Falkowbacteria bacterium]
MRYWLGIFLLAVSFGLVSPAMAALPSLVPIECQGPADISVCNLTAFEQMVANAAQIILGIAGSLTLLMFVIGGVQFLISGGNPKMIDKGKSTLKYATFGLALILLAGVAIKLLIGKLTGVT